MCSPLEACRSYPCALFDEWQHRWSSPPRGLISSFESWWEVKRSRFDLKFDVEPFGGILRPSIGSDRRFVIFDAVAEGSCSAVGGLKLGQMVSKWPETSCVLFFWLFLRILQFLFDSDKIWWLKLYLLIYGRMHLHVASWCWEYMKRQSDFFFINNNSHNVWDTWHRNNS